MEISVFSLSQRSEISSVKKNLLNLTFLVSDDPMYVDEAHYSPKFNKLIAYEIFKFIQLL